MAASRPDIPAIGLGTYRLTDEEECVASVRTALEVGYRHVDTAEAYGNEEAVGRGIAAADVDREDIFLATKVLHPRFTEDDGYTREGIVENVRACLDRLGVDRVDLLYGVHWPASGYDPETTFAACADVVDDGLADHIGVCNVTPALIDEAQAHSSVPIDAVQVEMHPLLPQAELRAYCEDNDMAFVAYAPLGNGAVLDDPVISELAEAHGVSEARVSLAWVREKGAHAIPKASSRDHIVDNWASLELDLDAAAVQRIDEEVQEERQYDPDYAPDW
ncbi:MAG TPA: aldo/keto reductase [Halobacteriales archaeon]|nr:aldo/keto reductase [Halobacteriales archaeon]